MFLIFSMVIMVFGRNYIFATLLKYSLKNFTTFPSINILITMEIHPQKPDSSTKRKEYDIETRAMALAYWQKGDSYRSIGKQLGLSHATVQCIVLKFKETGSIKNKKRNGRPPVLTPEAKKDLGLAMISSRESRVKTLGEIVKEFSGILTKDVSKSTVQRTLKEQGIKCHVAAVKPFVSESNAAKRVAWCQERLDWKVKDWKKVCI